MCAKSAAKVLAHAPFTVPTVQQVLTDPLGTLLKEGAGDRRAHLAISQPQ